MDTSVYIFMILLDVFISFTIFAIYFYVLFKYFMHLIEKNGIIKQLNIHLNFYKPILSLYKQYSKTNNDEIINLIQTQINNVNEQTTESDFSIATIAILSFILGLLFIVLVYFAIFYQTIIPEITLFSICITIITNLILIVGFELLFILYVYGNLELSTISYVLNIT